MDALCRTRIGHDDTQAFAFDNELPAHDLLLPPYELAHRLVTQQDLVEPTGGTDSDTGGRPARLYRFRRAVLDERGVAGTKLPRPR